MTRRDTRSVPRASVRHNCRTQRMAMGFTHLVTGKPSSAGRGVRSRRSGFCRAEAGMTSGVAKLSALGGGTGVRMAYLLMGRRSSSPKPYYLIVGRPPTERTVRVLCGGGESGHGLDEGQVLPPKPRRHPAPILTCGYHLRHGTAKVEEPWREEWLGRVCRPHSPLGWLSRLRGHPDGLPGTVWTCPA